MEPPVFGGHAAIASGRQEERNGTRCSLLASRDAGRHPFCAYLSANPESGKSRLAEELFQYCSRMPKERVARARCYFAQGRIAYGPVAEWLRAEPLRFARALLPRPQLAELARVLPEILVENPGIARPTAVDRKLAKTPSVRSAECGCSEKARKPLLLLIDDLQWCDHDSFEWLHSFFRSEPRRRPWCSAPRGPKKRAAITR